MNEKTEQGKSVGYWMKWKQEKAERVQWLLDEKNKQNRENNLWYLVTGSLISYLEKTTNCEGAGSHPNTDHLQ